MRRPARDPQSMDLLLTQTSDLVAQLVREHRSLQAQNSRLTQEVDRLSRNWDDIRRLARSAPRSRRGPVRRPQ
jgi:uncharacterized protein YlxW (UPF0749 family)